MIRRRSGETARHARAMAVETGVIPLTEKR